MVNKRSRRFKRINGFTGVARREPEGIAGRLTFVIA